jgi:hypothetical protein
VLAQFPEGGFPLSDEVFENLIGVRKTQARSGGRRALFELVVRDGERERLLFFCGVLRLAHFVFPPGLLLVYSE